METPWATTGFSDALVILATAGVVIPAFARLRLNPVIGFILVGIAVGPGGLGRFVGQVPWLYHITITDRHGVEPYAEFGIVLLLFSIGLELSFRRLWGMRKQVFGLGAAQLIGCAVLLAGGFLLAGRAPVPSFGLGMALALSSTALVLPLAGTSGPVGQRAFAMLLFEDLALVPIVFTLSAIAPSGGGDWQSLARTMVLGLAVVAALLVLGRLLLPLLFAQAARTKQPELFLAASLLVVALASFATSAAGLSPILGALLSGVLVAETDYRGEVEAIVAPFQRLALAVFLITVGMSLDLNLLARDWRSIALAVAGVVAVKAIVTGLLLRIGGARTGVAFETAFMMSAPSETSLIVLATAGAARLISPDEQSFWQIVTALGLTITPLLASIGRAAGLLADGAPHEELPPPDGDDARVLIVGFGRVGRLVAQMLDAHDQAYLALDADPDTVRHGRQRGYHVRFGNLARPGMIEQMKVASARAVVLTMDDPVQVVQLTKRLRNSFPDLLLIARARDPADAAHLYRVGATDAVPETVESSLQLSEAVLVDLGIAMGPVIASIHEKRSQLRDKIRDMAALDHLPSLGRRRVVEAEE